MNYILQQRKLVSVVISIIMLMASLIVVVKPVNATEQDDYDQAVNNCQVVESKLRTKIDELTAKRQDHLDKYSKVSGLFTSITGVLGEAGYDVDLLNELQPGLDRRIVTFTEQSQVFLSEVTDAADSACRDKASFKQGLEEARESLKQVQVSVADINKYIQEIVISSIKSTINGEGVSSDAR